LSAVFFFGGTATGFILTRDDMEWFYSFIPEQMSYGRNPATTTEALSKIIYEEQSSGLAEFSASLFSNNSLVSVFCFSLGFLLGVPTALLLFWNGLLLGALTALYHSRGLGPDIWGWILPHGVPELGAIVLSGAAGLLIGGSLLASGRSTRSQNLMDAGRLAGPIILGSIVLLVIAALIEGFFRQLVTDIHSRYFVVGLNLTALTLYFTLAGRSRK
jgi:uncharacterized membrane protein SpoIIM required for sporulation